MSSPYEAGYNTNYYSNASYDDWGGEDYGPARDPVAESNAYYSPRRSPPSVPFAMPEARVPGTHSGVYATDDWGQVQPTFSFPAPMMPMAPEPYYGPSTSFPAPYNSAPYPQPMHRTYPQPPNNFDFPDVQGLTSAFQQTNFTEREQTRSTSPPPPPSLLRSPSPYSSSSSSELPTPATSLYSRRLSSTSLSPSERSERQAPVVHLTWTPETDEETVTTQDARSSLSPISSVSAISLSSPITSSSADSFLGAETPHGSGRSRSSSSVTRKSSLGHSLSFRKPFASLKPSSSIAALLTPVPPSFEREPKQDVPYEDCEPVSLFSLTTHLEDGFPATFPPVVELSRTDTQHPFTTHDVTEGDWLLFLINVKTASSTSFSKTVASGTATMAKGMGRVAGSLRFKSAHDMKVRHKDTAVAELIAQWNNNFFHPRHLEVTLAQGIVRHSGYADGFPPDLQGDGTYKNSAQSVLLMSAAEFDNDEDNKPSFYGAQSLQRKEQEKERKAQEEKQKKELKRQAKASKDYLWRLVVSTRPSIDMD